ncbi:hypothetical protein [uncultured Xylophilus sp.]|uniref:hypothetical protein n=1 Tax=uncultured Xylophilus sp. TaxID=296832 RepID=UPI0025F5AC25|nr:hypothetical protein [uncultured Xylophilus sp.]
MYRLYPLGAIDHDPEALWLSYDWGESFDNQEWRQCVEDFLGEIKQLGHQVAPLSVPPFTPTEDFVKIEYLIGGVRTIFTSDHLLSLITVHPENQSVLRGAWESIGNRVGWETQ